jgi:hypothetical protein
MSKSIEFTQIRESKDDDSSDDEIETNIKPIEFLQQSNISKKSNNTSVHEISANLEKLNLEEEKLNNERSNLIAKLSIIYDKLSEIKNNKNLNNNIIKINKKNININDIEGFKKIGFFELNNRRSKTIWNFKPYNNIKNEKGSHIYIIVVNDIIKKIGCSANKKGIKAVAGYGVGNQGQPSDRTTGIHYYIGKELINKNEVSFWIKICSKVRAELDDLFGNVNYDNCSIDPKIQEDKYLESYHKLCGKFPEWNMQEQGRNADWEESIKNINRALKSKNILDYDKNKDYDDLMKLYHWKYNGISLPS